MENKDGGWIEPAWETELRLSLRQFLPLLLYIAGLFTRDLSLARIALFSWLAYVIVLTPWNFWRIINADRPGDGPRTLAILGYGALPWVLIAHPQVGGVLMDRLTLTFPLIFLWGAAFLILPFRTRPRLDRAPWRQLVVAGGVLSFAGLATTGVSLYATWGHISIAAAALIVLIGVSGTAALGLTAAMARELRRRS